MSITDILTEHKSDPAKILGVVVGIITNNQDPDGLGRVKVKIPRLSDADESNWARVATFMAGNDRGAFFLPEVDDEVLVAFEYGDVNLPYVIGSLWNGVDKPLSDNSDGQNNLRIIKSRSGHIIKLDDTDNQAQIQIIDNSGNNLITIDTQNKKIILSSAGDIELSATSGKVSIAAQNVEITASAAVKVEASADIDLKASGNMNIKGATVNIN